MRWRRPKTREHDLDRELRDHLELEAEDLRESGLPPDEAKLAAQRHLGNTTLIKEGTREMWGWSRWDKITQDAHYAARMLRRNPGFAVIAVLTLAFGIGANTAIYSVLDSVVLRPLPYPRPGQLYSIREFVRAGARRSPSNLVNAGNFLLWQQNAHSFSGVALLQPTGDNLNLQDETVPVYGARATADLFRILGIQLRMGLPFAAEADRSGRQDQIILTTPLWRDRFHSDPAIVGKTIHLNGYPVTVHGVLPESFYFPNQGELNAGRVGGWSHPIQYFINVGLRPDETVPGMGNFNYCVLGRLKPGVTPKQAVAELDAIEARAAPKAPRGVHLLTDLAPLQEAIVGPAKRYLWMVMAGAAIALLLVCVNLAGLMIARTTGRTHEVVLRTALGASRMDLLRQFLIEGLLIAATGGVLGLAGAYAGIRLLVAAAPVSIPRLESVGVNFHAVLFNAVAAIGAGMFFSLVPVLRMAAGVSSGTLRAASPTTSAGRSVSRVHQALAVLEIALCTVLLVAVSLIARSFARVLRANEWANVERVLTLNLNAPPKHYQAQADRLQLYKRLLESIRNHSEVEGAGLVNVLPFNGKLWTADVRFPEAPKPLVETLLANWRFVSPGYFHAIGLPLLQGSYFEPAQEGRQLAILSQGLARQLPSGLSPIGTHVLWALPGSGQPVKLEVIGVVQDARTAPDEQPPLTIYLPYWEWPPWQASLVVRTAAAPRAVEADLQRIVHRVDSSIAIPRPMTMHEVLNQAVASRSFATRLGLAFALSAMFVAALGLYGLISLAASQRIREIGIRIAVGADRRRIFWMMASQAMVLAAIGLVAGAAAAYAASRTLTAFLYEVSPGDPATFCTVCVGLLVIALASSFVPARRASRVDPVVALRYE